MRRTPACVCVCVEGIVGLDDEGRCARARICTRPRVMVLAFRWGHLHHGDVVAMDEFHTARELNEPSLYFQASVIMNG